MTYQAAIDGGRKRDGVHMAQGVIYMVDGDGLRRMTPSAPESEDRMQDLVARYPELITDGDGDLLLIRREHPVGDGEAEGRWSLDHLFVTREGVPVLVELKRAIDTRLRREVVGQMLDYAANATVHWQAGKIAESFARTAGPETADAQLAEFIGDRSSEEFWAQVDSNLKAGRIKLVFVADTIPRELARIVEFMNDQMRADIRAVELRWFAGDGGVTTLSPRVIGETERAAVAKRSGSVALPPMDVEDWIVERIGALGGSPLAGARRFLDVVGDAGGSVFVPNTQGSIVAAFADAAGRLFYPMSVSSYGRLKLMLVWLKSREPFKDEATRAALYRDFESNVGKLHTSSLAGGPGCDITVLLDDTVAGSLIGFLMRIADAVRGSG